MKNKTAIHCNGKDSSENSALADEIIHNIAKAKPAKRTRYTVELPNGLKVQTRSNKSYQELTDRFADKTSEPDMDEPSILAQSTAEPKVSRHDFGSGQFGSNQPGADYQPPHAFQADTSSARTTSVDPDYLAYLEYRARQNSMTGWPTASGPQWSPPPTGPSHQFFAPYPPQYPHMPYCTTRMSERVPTFLSWVAQKKFSRATLVDYRFTLRVFMELVGDKQLCDITVNDADLFLQAMNAWPCHASKKREFRKMKAPEVLMKAARLKVPTLTTRTQHKHIERLRVFFKWLEQRHEVCPGLLGGARLYKDSQDHGRRRKPFDDEDLQAIFDPKLTSLMPTPWRFWAPRLALYQGMRVNEIAQLYLEDVATVDGIPYLDINKDRPGQRLKNKNSRRVLPIHPEILKAGFMLYVKQVREAGLSHLFPGLTWGCNGPGDVVGDWFNRLLRKQCKITDPAKTFHSFRHCFATFGERSSVPDARLALMLGHSAGSSILRTHYVKRPTKEETLNDLKKIQFPPIDIGLYNPRKFDWYFEREKAVATRKERLDKVYGISK